MKMKWNLKRKLLAILATVYCILWMLTATWGISDVDRDFDNQFAKGAVGFAENSEAVPIQRIDTLPNVKDLMDPANRLPDDTGLFRYRTRGIAIAPCLILDEAATVFASLGGFGGMRINVWFFGSTHWWLVRHYWSV